MLASSAHAQPAPSGGTPTDGRDIGFLLRLNFDLGGDKIVDVEWSNGKKATLRAGQLFAFSGGLIYHPDAPWALEATVGYKVAKANGSNGSITFSRIPVDLIASWVNGRHRLGGGATVHFAPSFDCDAIGVCSDSASFDTALGGIIQWGYCLRPGKERKLRLGPNAGFEIGLRATYIKYMSSEFGTLNGSNVGFFFGFWF